MIYLTSFTLPSRESEENYLNKFYCTAPPPGVNYYRDSRKKNKTL